jgi:hypothetical protein
MILNSVVGQCLFVSQRMTSDVQQYELETDLGLGQLKGGDKGDVKGIAWLTKLLRYLIQLKKANKLFHPIFWGGGLNEKDDPFYAQRQTEKPCP